MALVRTSHDDRQGMLAFRTFREFPWQNGLVLHGPRIAEVFLEWSRDPPIRHVDIDSSILEVSLPSPSRVHSTSPGIHQGQAAILANFDVDEIHRDEERIRGVIRRDLGRARTDWFNLPPDGVNSQDAATAAHHILRHQVFDLLAEAVGFPTNPNRVYQPKVSLPKPLTPHLENVCVSSIASHHPCTHRQSLKTDGQ